MGLAATVPTARPFRAYSNALAGPGLTVGWQFLPRLALQLGGAYQGGK